MNNIVEFIERRKNESRKKMLHFSSYSIYDLISFVYFTIISFTSISPFLTSMNGFPFFKPTVAYPLAVERKERKFLPTFDSMCIVLVTASYLTPVSA